MRSFSRCVPFLLALILLLSSGIAHAEEIVGQSVKITGRWVGNRLDATRVQQQDPRVDTRRGQVTGRVDALDSRAHTFLVGPVLVEWNDATRFEGVSWRGLSSGQTLKARGQLVGPAHLIATSIEISPSTSDHLRIIGVVTAGEHRPNGSMQLTVLGVPIEVPQGTYARGSILTRRPDDRRPEEQLALTLWGRPLTVGGELGTESRYRGDFGLRDGAKDDVSDLDQRLELELFYPFTERVSLFLEGKARYQGDFYREAGNHRSEEALERGETWLYAGDLLGSNFSLQVGRQNFREGREWWWDKDLDALRIHYDLWYLHTEMAIARELGRVSTEEDRIDPEDQDVLWLLGHTAWSWARDQRLDAFFLYQNDRSSRQSIGQLWGKGQEDPSDAELLWLGVRTSGDLDLDLDRLGDLDYRLDGAWVGGREILFDSQRAGRRRRVSSRLKQDVTGWALDGGLIWETRLPGRPTLTLGYAVGSGDHEPRRGKDRSFRQTGLQDNNGRFRGVDRFRYYGELLRPELSNLQIWTASLGFRFWRSSSVELLYHLYRQVHPASYLRDARIDAAPMGRDRAIGQEWDLVIGLEKWEHLEIELVGALFRAGSAFGPLSGETAYQLILKVDYNF